MTFKHILRTSTALLGAALMALPSGIALAQDSEPSKLEGLEDIARLDIRSTDKGTSDGVVNAPKGNGIGQELLNVPMGDMTIKDKSLTGGLALSRTSTEDGPPDVAPDEAAEKLNADGLPYKLGRLHLNIKTIASKQEGCVTEAGAKDANCDGVDDAKQESAIDGRERPKLEPKPLENSESNNTATLKTLSAKEHQRLVPVKDLK